MVKIGHFGDFLLIDSYIGEQEEAEEEGESSQQPGQGVKRKYSLLVPDPLLLLLFVLILGYYIVLSVI